MLVGCMLVSPELNLLKLESGQLCFASMAADWLIRWHPCNMALPRLHIGTLAGVTSILRYTGSHSRAVVMELKKDALSALLLRSPRCG